MASEPKKIFHFEELLNHNHRESCWLLIHNKVFDVTNFLEEHPGGEEVLVASTEKDATDDYEDIGHSESAKEMMNKYYIGDIDVNSIPSNPAKKYRKSEVTNTQTNNSGFLKLLKFLLPLVVLAVALSLALNSK